MHAYIYTIKQETLRNKGCYIKCIFIYGIIYAYIVYGIVYAHINMYIIIKEL